MKAQLDQLYASFNHPESAFDPIQVVRRYDRLEDREIVAFVAAGLAFGRVASVVQSIEAVCRVMGRAPATFVRSFEPKRDGQPLRALVHRWTRGDDFVALLWILRRLLDEHGSLEAALAAGVDPAADDVEPALERFSVKPRARSISGPCTAARRNRRASTTSSRGPRRAQPASASTCSCDGWCDRTASIPAAGRPSRDASSSCRSTRTRFGWGSVCV